MISSSMSVNLSKLVKRFRPGSATNELVFINGYCIRDFSVTVMESDMKKKHM